MLSLANVSVALGGAPILSDVSLEVSSGELVALVGPNGAGKSTLLGVIAGDLEPSSGTAALDGTPMSAWKSLELARRRAVLQQEHRLAFGFRAVDVVRMGRTPWARTDREDEDDIVVADAMDRTEVHGFAERIFPTLSGGEKARVSFARVLSQQTRLVLLDEPTAALDLRHQDQVLAEARRLAAEGHAVITVVHDLSIAAAYADRICVLADGRLVADGTPEEVINPELIGKVYEHPVDVLRHQGRLLVVPQRLHAVPAASDAEEETSWSAAQ